MFNKKIAIISVLLVLAATSIFTLLKASPVKVCAKIPRVSHAGGGISKLTYTNSLNALNFNNTNYKLIELDFAFTSDEELVCIHDWEGTVRRTFDKEFDSIPPTLAKFNEYVKDNRKYKNCTFYSLATYLDNNPSKIIVTDVKGDNIKALRYIKKKLCKLFEKIHTSNLSAGRV